MINVKDEDKLSISDIIAKYRSLDYSLNDNYEELCKRYRHAVDYRENELAQKLYELMRDIQKEKHVNRPVIYLSKRRSFWKYVKHIGYKGIFSIEDVSKRLLIEPKYSAMLINEAIAFRLIYKDGPTTYRMRNPKKINGNDIHAYLKYGRPRAENQNSDSGQNKNKHQKEVDRNYVKLLEASGKSNAEIQRNIDKTNRTRETLEARRKGNEIARKRNSINKTNWSKDARKMQNNQPEAKYKTMSGSLSTKKEQIDPDEKDKKKVRDLQLGAAKHFIDFYGLDG